jgi:hypothetical protein
MSRPEIERITGGMHVLRALRIPCWYAVLGDRLLDKPEAEARDIFSGATSWIVQAQRRAGYPQHWMRVSESAGGLHANIIFPAPPEVAARFKRSAFGAYCQGNGFQQIGPTTRDWRNLASYLSGERTPQAEVVVGHLLGPRVPGSHPLGEGGGDRVQLSPALYDDALRLGLIEPYQRTKSKALSRSPQAARLIGNPQAEAEAPAASPISAVMASVRLAAAKADDTGAPAEVSGAGQDEALGPQSLEALAQQPGDGIGQEPKGVCPACPVEPSEPVQLLLFAALPCSPPPFSTGPEIRDLRERIGLSQRRLAGQIGIRDRSHLANVERGHDRLSPPRRRLLRHIMDSGRLAA